MQIAPVRATVTAQFRDETDALADPSTVTFVVEPPEGSTTTYVYGVDSEVTRSGVGVFVLTVIVTDIGNTGIRATGTGAIAASAETSVSTVAPRVG